MKVNNQYDKGKISFCVLGYKHRDFIEDCIKSIWEIDYENKEIIAVDDGSKDGSDELLHNLEKKSACPFTVITQENTGKVGYNFNKALEKASGEFVTFISLDDLYNTAEISTMIKDMASDSNLIFNASSKIQGIAIEKNEFVDIEELKINEIENPTLNDLLELEFNYFGAFYIQGCIFRKEIIDKINGFDEDLTGDDIILRTKLFRYMIGNNLSSFKLHDNPSVFYRRHSNNISNNSTRQMKIVSEYYERYWPGRESSELFHKWYYASITPENFKQLKNMNQRLKDGYYHIRNTTDIINVLFFKLYKEITNTNDYSKVNVLNELYDEAPTKSKKMILIHSLLKLPFGRIALKKLIH